MSSLLDSVLEEFRRAVSSLMPGTEIGLVMLCAGFGVASVLIVVKGYLRRRRVAVSGAPTDMSNAPAAGRVEAVARAAPGPAPPPAPAASSGLPATTPTRTPLASRRYGGTYVRRTAPRRSTATKESENKPS